MTKRLLALTGELLLIAAAVIGLYLVYQLWFTNVEATERALVISERLKEDFRSGASTDEVELVPVPDEPFSGIGLLYIPVLGDDVWGTPVLDDVSERALASGIGHYPATALPGEVGNFAIAAHRATNGEPFARFERLRPGDLVYIETSAGFFTYELFADQKIPDSDVWVISEMPEGIVSEPTELITLTTCDPRWNSTQRWARWGKLVAFSKDAPKELIR